MVKVEESMDRWKRGGGGCWVGVEGKEGRGGKERGGKERGGEEGGEGRGRWMGVKPKGKDETKREGEAKVYVETRQRVVCRWVGGGGCGGGGGLTWCTGKASWLG